MADNERINAAHKANMAIFLARQAIAHADAGELENAAWRLADAAGLLREHLTATLPAGTDLIGLHSPTGRGYTLPTIQA